MATNRTDSFKKALEGNPALSFFNDSEVEQSTKTVKAEQPTATPGTATPTGNGPAESEEVKAFMREHKAELEKYFKKENRSRKVNTLMTQSTYDRIKARAEATGVSVNNVINDLLEKALEEIE